MPAGADGAPGADGVGDFVRLFDDLLSGTQASFDFTPISGSYKHLELRLYLRGTASSATVLAKLRFNNDSGSNYGRQLNATYGGNNESASGPDSADAVDLSEVTAATGPASHFGQLTVDVNNYAGTTGVKALRCQGGYVFDATPSLAVTDTVAFWGSTSAITRVTVYPASGSWAAGSRATLYGLN